MFQRTFLFFSALLLLPQWASAHEVYVLSDEQIQAALATPSFSFAEVFLQHSGEALFWAVVGFVVVAGVFTFSISHKVERIFDPFLMKLPPYAPVIGRITIGLSFLAAAYYQALFGPELPLAGIFGAYAPFATAALVVIGVMIIVGTYARIAALGALVLFAAAVYAHGSYMITYTNYVGELVLLLVLGAHTFAWHHKGHDRMRAPAWFLRLKAALTPYAFLILRVAFGVSLVFSAVYAKIVHNQLALAVAVNYPEMTAFFGFAPEFLVFGAALIEITIGIFFILGIEIRFTALFMLFWLSLSLWYFGESVWPHIILIGIPLALVCYGYDRNSVEGYFFKRGGYEPVL